MNLCPGVNLPVDMVVINPSFRESIVACSFTVGSDEFVEKEVQLLLLFQRLQRQQ